MFCSCRTNSFYSRIDISYIFLEEGNQSIHCLYCSPSSFIGDISSFFCLLGILLRFLGID